MKQTAVVALAIAIVALLAAIAYQNHRKFHRPLLTTEYQAVMLNNGTLYYGRIDHLGTDYPVLRDAFSVREEADARGGKPAAVIVRHRDGLNGADHVIVPATSIAWVQPVRPDSPVGRLIAQKR